ncbi:hypothetical protein EWM64_g2704 [Hericium alpestre]|uniref:Uncharacterized protein n=1 Tax=Hericium alpestre TaxID=135208 RepID=A0A4Z0A6M2_9AGAM|nr:hypothetical protein EWM64_g2704 [Hericium alpestre]
MASSSRSEVAVSRSGARQSLPLPTEFLRTVVLGHLAASFWILIVEPGLDKEWNPLSPLLHSSFQLREIATSFLDEILGETRFKDHPTRASVKTYKLFLSELKRLKTLGETGDPTVILELDTMFAATMAGLHECDSPILWLARECAMRTLYLRIPEMCPTIEQDVDLQQKLSHYADYVVAA